MTVFSFIKSSLYHYRRRHAAVVAGVAVAVTVLVGALVIGDSVRHSLLRMSRVRLGTTRYALHGGDRFFRAQLAEELRESLSIPLAALLHLEGTVKSGKGDKKLNHIQILGVDSRFWEFGLEPLDDRGPGPGEAHVDRRVAEELGVKAGDAVVLRVRKPQAMPAEVSFSSEGDGTWTERVKIAAVVSDEQMGRFSLQISQIPQANVFVSRDWLSHKLEFTSRDPKPGSTSESRANLLLAGSGNNGEEDRGRLKNALKGNWTLHDAGLSLETLSPRPGAGHRPGVLELRSEEVFLGSLVEEAAHSTAARPRGILTYFVNSIRSGDSSTPYSFVSAPGSPLVPEAMDDGEILLNEWTARDLGAKVGDRIELTYFTIGPFRKLEERSSTFELRAVVPIEGHAADRTLMPDFPGIADVASCTEWDPAIPVDLDRIREKDEKYWDDHRGTPKAFLTLKAAQKMWANDWGRFTAIRFEDTGRTALEKCLLEKLPPAALGLRFHDVRAESEKSGSSGVDFGQLFLGLSFFLIVSALILTGLLFALGLQDRSDEVALLLGVGFSPRRVRTLHLLEGSILVLIGSLLGIVGGGFYNQVVLAALSTLWRDAVGTQALVPFFTAKSLLAGGGSGVICALVVMWIVLRRMTRQAPEALRGGGEGANRMRRVYSRISLVVALCSGAGALVIALTEDPGRGQGAAMAFFGAGGLLLLSGLAFTAGALLRIGSGAKSTKPSLFALGLRRTARRPLKSVAVIAILACGIFLVVAVGANRKDLGKGAEERSSGTGGYAFFGETAIPVLEDLRTPEGRKAAGIRGELPDGAGITLLRRRRGDDASCLNLNRVARPRILGVAPAQFSERGAFTFVKTVDGIDPAKGWEGLDLSLSDGAVPGIADEAVILWGLGKSLGDTLTYADEKGREFSVRLVGGLANSVFQGHILISEKAFRERFPSVQGAEVLLVDAPDRSRKELGDRLEKALDDHGLVLTPAADRLAAFQAVENTYLDIFMLLGGLGLILGSAGLAVVVVRNVLERRSEMAMLQAVGFSRKTILKMLLWEHIFLFLAGMGVGALSATVAVIPALSSPGAPVPFLTLGALLAILLLSGIAWISCATRLALKGDLVPALRDD
ncbi:MAG: FtsX-like permease family protein [Planctomycetota bacterium]|jgi:putative ABC transport system permease protein